MFDEVLRAFADVMNGGAPWGAAFFLVALACPLVLVHELGHAAVMLAVSDQPVTIRVGRSPGWWRCRIKRLSIELSPVPSVGSQTAGSARTAARVSPRLRLLSALAGPMAEVLVAIGLLPVFIATDGAARGLTGAGIAAAVVHVCWNRTSFRSVAKGT